MKNKKELQKALASFEKIKQLSNENFVLLSPTGGKEGDYYMNYVRIYGYAELFRTLKSVVNVCVLSLEGQIDLTLDIKNKEDDVIRVLEFAKCLIPLEEGIYLDEMRKLMLSDENNQ
ncbi:hypothetical protein SAMN04487906_2810 [Zhouia amylolytica]|uniref:Uncharacterized protein n=1 Tax=Zhouia amylolytica TaxID=376730 RepID=A0A1I6V2E4_9FLAO|nr:hypothetical protein [Zhouia amylolytica]SFT07727.1 hypothetical protein SAMN04487906_2810 [Zhouia amylolytica]